VITCAHHWVYRGPGARSCSECLAWETSPSDEERAPHCEPVCDFEADEDSALEFCGDCGRGWKLTLVTEVDPVTFQPTATVRGWVPF
jgi:hypothetical protein